jgi:hypothetical protein
MKKNTLIRIVLLGFVAAAIVTIFVRSRGSSSSPAPAKSATAPAPEGSSFVAYYFHGTRRCVTCKAIQAQAQEAITTRLAEELRKGRLRWEAVNLEEMGNDHYASAYDVTGSTLVIAEVKGGRPVRFAKLEQTWELVRNKPAFLTYVADEVAAFMKAKR